MADPVQPGDARCMRTVEVKKPSGRAEVAAAMQGPIEGHEEEFPGGIARLGLGSADGDARPVGGILRFNLVARRH
jgi:hypothetical protein